HRVVGVRPEGRNTTKAYLLVQTDGGVLVDAGLQPKDLDAVTPGEFGQMVEHQLAETRPRNCGRTHIRLISPYSVPNSLMPPQPAGTTSSRTTKKVTASAINFCTPKP